MLCPKGRKGFSLTLLLSSFFGALFIASVFAYYNYKFSQYATIDFKEWIFYTKDDIFIPKQDRYFFVVISSRDGVSEKIIEVFHNEFDGEVVVLDIYQDSQNLDRDGVTYLRAGTDNILKVIQRFNIYEVPVFFEIKKFQGNLYKQDSPLKLLRSKDA